MRKIISPKNILVVFAIMLLCPKKMQSQTIDEIVEKHITAMGGKEKLDSLKTVIIEGTFRLENFELPLKAYLMNNMGQRYEVMVMKIPGFIIATPKEGWQYFPFQGMKEPQLISQDELDIYQPYMDLQGALFKYKEKGTLIDYIGLEEIDEIVCYKLSAILNNGKKLNAYIDTGSYYLIKTDFIITTNGKETKLENRYANFQKTREGYIFPFALTLGPGQAFVSKIYINIVIDPLLFNPTKSIQSGF